MINDIETDAAELRKDADAWDLVAGKWLAALTTEQYADRLEGICKDGEGELAIHRASIASLPPYVVTALRESDTRTLHRFRTRRGAECLHLDVESWWHLGGGRQAAKSQGIFRP